MAFIGIQNGTGLHWNAESLVHGFMKGRCMHSGGLEDMKVHRLNFSLWVQS